jgi:WD40 repeat protein
LTYQHQGDLLASGGEDGQVILWKPSMQRGAISIAKHGAPISQLAWSADDQRLVVGTAGGQVLLYAV